MINYTKTLKYILIVTSLAIASIVYSKPQVEPVNFVTLADVHLDHTLQTTTFYDHTHDTGMDVWHSTLNELTTIQTQNPYQFMILLGDLPAHDTTTNERITNDHQVLADLRSSFPTLPIFYVPGNNDSPSGDYHSFTNTILATTSPLDTDPGFHWPAYNVPDCTSGSAKPCVISKGPEQRSAYFYGAYSAYPSQSDHLRLIVLNSIAFLNHKNGTYVSDDLVTQAQAIDEQLNWLEEQLQAASQYNEQIIIALHIPPGLDAYKDKAMWEPDAEDRFINLMSQYRNNVIAVLSAHTHFDEIRIIQNNKYLTPVIDWSTAGINTSHGNNPGLKLFNLNMDPIKILNYHDYHCDKTLVWNEFYTYNNEIASQCFLKDPGNCLGKLAQRNKLFPLIQTFYAEGNTDFNGWSHVADSIWVKPS